MKYFCNATLDVLNNLDPLLNKEFKFWGIIIEVEHKVSKNGKGWASFY